MDRDTFWESIWDILKLVFKLVLILAGLQVLLMLFGSDMKIPYIHAGLHKLLDWFSLMTSGVRYGSY